MTPVSSKSSQVSCHTLDQYLDRIYSGVTKGEVRIQERAGSSVLLQQNGTLHTNDGNHSLTDCQCVRQRHLTL